MRKAALHVTDLSKRYKLGSARNGEYRTLRETISHGVSAIFRPLFSNGTSNGEESSPNRPVRHSSSARIKGSTIWALRHVSFDVQPGEVVGVIGRNGAGKSTLLKILSRITEPSTGRVEARGRVGSLLEVGTGFHPELTGRENVFLNGAILGMTKREITRRFDEIVAFAEIEQFLDTPVKRYSSGMYVRLAFAVAAHLDPEILVVDEVLAVGDAQFQQKCLGKMHDVAVQGRTILLVSHNMTAVQSLCERAIWLSDGTIAGDGPTKSVVSEYLRKSYAPQREQLWDDMSTAPGVDNFRLRRVCVRPADDRHGEDITVRTPILLEIEYWSLEPGTHLNISLHLYNDEGIRVFNTAPVREPNWHGKPFEVGLYRSICHIPGNLLNDGAHRVQLLAVEDQARVIYNLDDAIVFDVADAREPNERWHGAWAGAVRPDLEWSTELVEAGLAR